MLVLVSMDGGTCDNLTITLGSPSRSMKQLNTVRRMGTMYLADNWSTVPRWAGPIIAYKRATRGLAIERSECGTARLTMGPCPIA